MGSLSIKQWHREELQHLTRIERKKKNYAAPIEEKESYRWLENYKLANEYAIALPNTLIVSIADREGDIYDIYEEVTQTFSEGAKGHYSIRAKTDRKVCDEKGEISENKIKSTLKGEQPLGELIINISENQKRKARKAHMSVYSKDVHIAVPDKRKKEKSYKPIEITAILYTENNPPAGMKAIEWLLITDLPERTFEEACEKIQWYTCRWKIEIFLKY